MIKIQGNDILLPVQSPLYMLPAIVTCSAQPRMWGSRLCSPLRVPVAARPTLCVGTRSHVPSLG